MWAYLNSHFNITIQILLVIIEGDLNHLSSLLKSIYILNFFLELNVIIIFLIVIVYLDLLIIASFIMEIENYFLTGTLEI